MAYIGNTNTHNGRVGKIGEDFAVEHLESLGHTIVSRNLRLKMGEIDIVTSFHGKLHIIEVKTSQSSNVRPEENMNLKKLRKVAKLAEIYSQGKIFSIGFIGVSLNQNMTLKSVVYIENLEVY